VVQDTDSGSFSTSLTIAEYGILGDLLAFLAQSPADFTTFGEMTDADNLLNPQHFGSDPTDIRIRIGISSEIRIRIPDHFRFRFDGLAERGGLRSLSTVWVSRSFLVHLQRMS